MENTGLKVQPSPVRIQTMQHLKIYNKQDVLSLTRLRRFETKVGEQIHILQNSEEIETLLNSSTCKYVLFGIPEDLGAKGNFGIGGGLRHSRHHQIQRA